MFPSIVQSSSLPFWLRRFGTRVVFVDPRMALEKGAELLDASTQGHNQTVALTVPPSLLPSFAAARPTLDDYDEPINNWSIGKDGELFQYQLEGTVPSPSGFIAAITEEDLRALPPTQGSASTSAFRHLMLRLGVQAPTPAEAFELLKGRFLQSGAHAALHERPFLFFGNVLEAGAVNVYSLRGTAASGAGSEVEGVLVTSGDELMQGDDGEE